MSMNSRFGERGQQVGFSLIEAMVTVSILATVLSIGVPSFQSIVVANRMTALANELVLDLNTARSEAVKRNARVALCLSENADASDPTCGSGTDWTQGRVVFSDPLGAGSHDSNEPVLKVNAKLPAGFTLKSEGIDGYLQFTALGQPSSVGQFVLCKQGEKGRTITITAAGHVQTTAKPEIC